MSNSKDTCIPLKKAFDFFNENLFGAKLPPCIITMHRHKGAYGYFKRNSWTERDGDQRIDEIALNPETFENRDVNEILSTLVHEMCHMYQFHFGSPSRGGYHNREWANLMESVGLIPTDNGFSTGKKTGQNMTHYIQDGGSFDGLSEQFIRSGFKIPWQAIAPEDSEERRRKKASKTKYTCPQCGLNAWARPNISLICGGCSLSMEIG